MNSTKLKSFRSMDCHEAHRIDPLGSCRQLPQIAVVTKSHKPPHSIEQPDDGKPLTAWLNPKEVHELPNGDTARTFGDFV